MFVHNSEARIVIHLFARWCRVLQRVDERQSAVGMCGRVRTTIRTDDPERDRIKDKTQWEK